MDLQIVTSIPVGQDQRSAAALVSSQPGLSPSPPQVVFGLIERQIYSHNTLTSIQGLRSLIASENVTEDPIVRYISQFHLDSSKSERQVGRAKLEDRTGCTNLGLQVSAARNLISSSRVGCFPFLSERLIPNS